MTAAGAGAACFLLLLAFLLLVPLGRASKI